MAVSETGMERLPAVFLDKDGTLIEDVPYNVDPALIRLAKGAREGLSALHEAGFRLVVISNQSGVARGFFPIEAIVPVRRRLEDLLAEFDVFLTDFLYCPHHPAGVVREYAITCDCRKPAPGMMLRAAETLGIDLKKSWMIGDILDDVEAANRAGCRAVLIDNGHEIGMGFRAIPATGAQGGRSGRGGLSDPGGRGLLGAAAPPSKRRSAVNPDAIAAWSRAENVLCVRLDALGDVLMTTPALCAIKEARPGRRVTLLTSPTGAEAASLLPMIDEVLVYDAPWMKATAPRLDSRPDFDQIECLRRGRFDAAAIFTVYSQNPLPAAMLCYLADIPRRLAHCRENPYQLLNDWVPDPEPDRLARHEVRRQLDLVACVGCRIDDERMVMTVPDEARAKVDRLLSELGLAGRRDWVVVHPGATAPSRRYPPELFAEAARRIGRGGTGDRVHRLG